MSAITCNICGKPDPENIFRCDEHYRCDDCHTREGLCTYTEGVLCSKCHTSRVAARTAAFEGDTEDTDEVICPHCGYLHPDGWEMTEGARHCADCCQPFDLTRIVTLNYTTTKATP